MKTKKYKPGTTVIITKDGKKHVGFLSEFKPEENYLSIRISFDDIKSAVEYGHIISIKNGAKNLDLLEQARRGLKQARENNLLEETYMRKWEKE